ncbi:MAG: pantoate--beta-alanine ligase [Planctomycetes bacterium]|nr:pantoate--beta-alanine ligase [Planctomycetota bacterium]
MEVLTRESEIAAFKECAFVPTMGALHEGHLSLIRMAKKTNRPVVVSIFVNPEQFSPEEDLDTYPRNLEQDCAFAASVGADAVFAPSVETMYPTAPQPIALPDAATMPQLEDACRPAHFMGVCVAVARLFDLVQPAVTVFGLKDYQQYLVVKQLIVQEENRWKNLKILGAEIIRDEDGLAMSSRNVYLTTEQRKQSLGLHKAISCTTQNDMVETLNTYGLDIEYAVLRSSRSLLTPIDGEPVRALVAARLGNIRLIDNAEVQP